MEKNEFKILRVSGNTFQLPVFLDCSVDEMGVMVEFDGDIEKERTKCLKSIKKLTKIHIPHRKMF